MSDKLRAAAKAALEWLNDKRLDTWQYMEDSQFYADRDKQVKALEAALAEPAIKKFLTVRPWVGLTDREFQPMIQKAMAYYGYDQSEPSHLTAGAGFRAFAYAIEAKLKEKNHV